MAESLHDSQVRLYGAHPAVCSTCGTGRVFRLEDGFWTCTQCQAGFRPLSGGTAAIVAGVLTEALGADLDTDDDLCFGCDQPLRPGHVCPPVVLPATAEIVAASRRAVLVPRPHQPGDEGPADRWGPDRDENGREL